MLVLSRKPNEAILLEDRGRRIRILVSSILGSHQPLDHAKVRIAIEAPPDVVVWREELGEFERKDPKRGQSKNIPSA